MRVKTDRFAWSDLGRNKTLLMLFFNSSLRTRLSTQKAAMNLGMNVMVLDVNQGAWKLETERGVVMDGDKAEHLLEAIPVMASYCDMIGVRAFAGLADQRRRLFRAGLKPIFRLRRLPCLQHGGCHTPSASEFCRPYHDRGVQDQAAPQGGAYLGAASQGPSAAVANSFAEWMRATDYEFVITHPEGYELAPDFVGDAKD